MKPADHSSFHESNEIHPTAIIYDNVEMGENNVIGPYTVIGSNGEMRGVEQKDFKGGVVIGDGNVISEHVTIQRPYLTNRMTYIGSNNIIMAHTHIGHDAEIGDNIELCTGTIIGGYAKVENGSKLKLGVIVRNRRVIGENCIVGMGAVVVKDVNNDEVVYGNPARVKK